MVLLQLLACLFAHASTSTAQTTPECTKSKPCLSGQFCNFDFDGNTGGFCESCSPPDECYDLGLPEAGAKDCKASCENFTSHESSDGTGCTSSKLCPFGEFCNFDYGINVGGFCESCVPPDECYDLGLPDAGGDDCKASCQDFVSPTCNTSSPCSEDFFCAHDDAFGINASTCEECVWHPHECFNLSLSDAGVMDCTSKCIVCDSEYYTELLVDEISYNASALGGSPSLSAEGLLVNCDKGLDICSDAEGAICLIERGDNKFWEKVLSCEGGGGVGAIVFNNDWNDFGGILSDVETLIPSVSLSGDNGQHLLANELGSDVSIHVEYSGEYCRRGCSNLLPCADGEFCNWDFDDYGFCEECKYFIGDGCYFSGLPQAGAQDCEKICGSRLTFPSCKFCPKDVQASNFGLDDSNSNSNTLEGKCEFCPNNDLTYPDREMSMFGGVACWLVREFFDKYETAPNDPNCRLAQMFNYQCGCSGPGYAGADTDTKRIVLAWAPRVSATLSFLCSLLIVIDVGRIKTRRSKLSNQMLFAISIFDMIGSIAYALTTLPTPEADYIYGSKGSEGTCKAQAFFIQIGTISAYINVSLALYYLAVIKFSYSEMQLKKKRIWLFLCPIVTGLAFAFAGLPFYDNTILWCNNSAAHWPEIPIIIAIAAATGAMATVCWHVRQTEAASKKGAAANHNLSKKVFWQSMWYLMAFYMTWPPYLVLQYLWVSGKAYTMYGFVLFAGMAVPLQGFWNCLAYFRQRTTRRPSSFFRKPTYITSMLKSLRASGKSKHESSAVSSSSQRHAAMQLDTGMEISDMQEDCS